MIQYLFKVAEDLRLRKVAIYGTDDDALRMFSVLLQNDVYVSCFLGEEEDTKKEIGIMNKPIAMLSSIQDVKEEYVIIMYGQKMLALAEKLDKEGYTVFFDYNKTSYDGDSIMIGEA